MIVKKNSKKKKEFSRFTVLFIIMACIFTLIITKLMYIQIYKYDDYKDKADTTSTRFISTNAPRGKIYDSDGNILATNKQTYALSYTSTDEADANFYGTMDKLIKIFDENGESFKDELKIKLDENDQWYFDYSNKTDEARKTEYLRFLKDRSFDENLTNKLFEGESELTEEQEEKLNNKLLEITPDEIFKQLVYDYDLIDLLKLSKEDSDNYKQKYKKDGGNEIVELLTQKYSLKQLRIYLLVKDYISIQSLTGYKSVTFTENISSDTSAIIYQKLNDLPGIDVTTSATREYPYTTLGSSVIGYLSSIDESKKENYELRGYDASTDLIGVAGIESAFEDQLKGTTGGTTVKVNSKGRVTEELFKLEAYPGNNVNLTINKNVQFAAQQALQDTLASIRAGGEYPNATRGAVVAVEVDTGRIIALASYPDYDPNLFVDTSSEKDEEKSKYFSPDLDAFGSEYISKNGLNKSLDDMFPKNSSGVREDLYDVYPKAFYNYATLGTLPPGSTFKPMTAIAGLETGVIDAGSTIYDSGTFNSHPDVFGSSFGPQCWLKSGHGSLDVTNALAVSCNGFFYEVGYRLYTFGGAGLKGLDTLAYYGWKFGLGTDPNGNQKASTGIEIEENFGQIYNLTSWKNQVMALAKYDLRDALEAGYYKDRGISFIPFDYSANEDDNEDLKNAKLSLKEKINERFKLVASNESAMNTTEFAKSILDDVKNIMSTSDKYKQNITEYEASHGSVDTDKQAKVIANLIAVFVIEDKGSNITSPAQEVYAAIGQGMNNFTPIQMAQYISTFANGGTRYKLHLVDSVTTPEGDVVQQYNPEVLDETNLKPETIRLVTEGMKKVTEDEGGTATTVFNGFPIQTAGKTGTADFSDTQTEIGREPYATYIGFAPADSPKIAVVCVGYDAGHGASIAPVAKAVYEAYFKDQLMQQFPAYCASSDSFQKYVTSAPADNKEE